MKKLFIAMLALAMVGCIGKRDKKETGIIELEPATEVVENNHNAKNSLDYWGVYSSEIEISEGQHAIVTIALDQESNYAKTTKLSGTKEPEVVEKGKFTWNEKGNAITLIGAELPNEYFVAEISLIQLVDGERPENSEAHTLYMRTE